MILLLSVVIITFLFFYIIHLIKSKNQGNDSSSLDGKVDLLSKTLNNIQEKLGTNINNHGKTEEHLKNMGERLAIIDKAQSTFDLLTDRVNDLQNILSNKQLRGAFGEVQLENLVKDYSFFLKLVGIFQFVFVFLNFDSQLRHVAIYLLVQNFPLLIF